MRPPFHVEPAKPRELDRLRVLAQSLNRGDRLTACWLICQRVRLAESDPSTASALLTVIENRPVH